MTDSYKNLLKSIATKLPNLPAKLQGIGRFILGNYSQVVFMTIKQLAGATEVSEATVMRFVNQFGYTGYSEFLGELRQFLSERLSDNSSSSPAGPWSGKIQDEWRQINDLLNRLAQDECYSVLIQFLPSVAHVYIMASPAAAAAAADFQWELSRLRPGVSLNSGPGWKEQEELAGLPEGSMVVIFIKGHSTKDLSKLMERAQSRQLPLFVISDHYTALPRRGHQGHALILPLGPLGLSFAVFNRYLMAEIEDNCRMRYPTYKESLEIIAQEHQPFASRRDTLQLAVSYAIKHLDPAAIQGHMREGLIMRCLYQGLVKFKEGTWEVEPELATHWQVSDDGLSAVFYLRQGVQFHQDYGEFTAADVKFSFERIAQASSLITGHSVWRVLDEVVVLSRHAVKLILKHPCPHLFTSILALSPGMIVSKRAMERIGESQFALNPVGTGPYEVKSFRPREAIELNTFPHYWGAEPKTRRLIIRLDTHAFNFPYRFVSGQLDAAIFPNVNPRLLEETSGVEMCRQPGFYQFWWLGLMVNKPPFNNLMVRQAVRWALDRRHIREAGLFSTIPLNTLIPQSVKGHWAEAPAFDYNPDKARELLGSSGVKLDQPIVLAADPTEVDVAALEIIKANLVDAGFNTQLELINRQVLLEKIRRQECHMYLYFYNAFMDPYLSLSWFTKDQFFNFSHWHNPGYDALIEDMAKETNEARRLEMAVEAQKIIIDDCWAVWLAQGQHSILHQNNVDVGKPWPDGFLTTWTMSKN